MDDALHTLLRAVDTPTVCNAIEVAQGKRGFNAFTRGTMLASDPDGVMVGSNVCGRSAGLVTMQMATQGVTICSETIRNHIHVKISVITMISFWFEL